jgi:hypothetical protein
LTWRCTTRTPSRGAPEPLAASAAHAAAPRFAGPMPPSCPCPGCPTGVGAVKAMRRRHLVVPVPAMPLTGVEATGLTPSEVLDGAASSRRSRRPGAQRCATGVEPARQRGAELATCRLRRPIVPFDTMPATAVVPAKATGRGGGRGRHRFDNDVCDGSVVGIVVVVPVDPIPRRAWWRRGDDGRRGRRGGVVVPSSPCPRCPTAVVAAGRRGRWATSAACTSITSWSRSRPRCPTGVGAWGGAGGEGGGASKAARAVQAAQSSRTALAAGGGGVATSGGAHGEGDVARGRRGRRRTVAGVVAVEPMPRRAWCR